MLDHLTCLGPFMWTSTLLLRDTPPLESTWSLHMIFILYLTSSKRDIVPCEHIIGLFYYCLYLARGFARKWFWSSWF
jgi:hypothetical protein